MKTVLSYSLIVSFCIPLLGMSLSRSSSDRTRFRCDYNHMKAADIWMKFHEMPTNWHEARLRCHMEGATLASPLSLMMKGAMKELMSDKGMEFAAFTGISAIFSNGDFASVEGVPLSQIPHSWAKDEPDNYMDQEKCIAMLPDGALGDVECNDTFPYMCYKNISALAVNKDCGTTDGGYSYTKTTGHCYKFHKEPNTWSRAYMTCAAEGGYLVIINGFSEAEYLITLFAANEVTTHYKFAFVGFHDWNEHGEWRTVHGQTLKEAGYTNFLSGEPNNATTGEYCGAMYTNAQINDLTCDSRYAFICEKEPLSLACKDN